MVFFFIKAISKSQSDFFSSLAGARQALRIGLPPRHPDSSTALQTLDAFEASEVFEDFGDAPRERALSRHLGDDSGEGAFTALAAPGSRGEEGGSLVADLWNKEIYRADAGVQPARLNWPLSPPSLVAAASATKRAMRSSSSRLEIHCTVGFGD